MASLREVAFEPLFDFTSPLQREKLDAFSHLLFAEAMPAGYVGLATEDEILTRHILDSVLPALAPESKETFPLWSEKPLNVFDLGAGAGLPSLPLAVLFPQHTFYLLDAQEKRLRFVAHAAGALDIHNVKTYHGVVQDIRKSHSAIPFADVVVFRAFRKILASLELALHVVHPTATSKVLYWRSQKVPFTEVGLERVQHLGFTLDTFAKFASAEKILPRGLYTFTRVLAPKKPYPRAWKRIAKDPLVERES